MDKWQSGDFSIQTWCIPLEAFTSKKSFNSEEKIQNYLIVKKTKQESRVLQFY